MLGFRNQPRRETAPLVALAKPHGLKGTEPRARGPVGVTTPLLVCLLCTGTECCAVRLGLSSNVFRMHLVAQKHRFLKEDLVFLFQRRFGWALFINCRSQTPAAETAASFRFTVSLRATARLALGPARRPPPSPGAGRLVRGGRTPTAALRELGALPRELWVVSGRVYARRTAAPPRQVAPSAPWPRPRVCSGGC